MLLLINTYMPDVNISLSKWYHGVIALLPVLALIGSFWLWLDTRYMHKEISDNRFIQLQIDVVSGQLTHYNRMIDDGTSLSAKEIQDYEMYKCRLQMLEQERSKKLQIGGLPE